MKILFGLVLLFSLTSCLAPQSTSFNDLTIEQYEKKMRDLGYKFTARASSYGYIGIDHVRPFGGASGKSQAEANDMAMKSCKRDYMDCVVVMEGSQLTSVAETIIFSKKKLAEDTKKYQDERMKIALKDLEEQEKSKKLYEREKRFKYLEESFGNNCKNNKDYNKCLDEQEQLAKKQKVEEDKLNKMLAAMKPEERRAYVCEKTYGLRKGSDKFSECIYKILAADVELEKIELQKKLAEAQLATAKANEAAARANASASASRSNVQNYDPNVAAAMERANEIERAKILLNLSQALRTPPASPQLNAPPRQQNCKLNPYNNRITCF